MKSTVLLIGPGDLASRIVQGLIHDTRSVLPGRGCFSETG